MTENPKFLAEGAYGCVHRPSLRCSETIKIDYKNKISKIMSEVETMSELKEYVLIEGADKKSEFYLGKPETCDFEKSKINIPAVKKCKNRENILDVNNKFKLLIMPDGGDNLEVFAKKMRKSPSNKNNKLIMENFWIGAKQLLYGIKAFIKHDLLHHDLKPQNIVYDINKNRCNFIDFGLMEKINTSITQAFDGKYWFAKYHWNFTIESEFLDINYFNQFIKLTQIQRNDKIRIFNERNIVNLSAFFNYITNNSTEKNNYLLEWSNFLLNDINDVSFENFIEKAFTTFDLYGVGLTLLHVLRNTKHLTNSNLYLQLDELFNSMISPNLIKRVDINGAIKQYENIIIDTANTKKKDFKNILQLENDIKLLVKDMKQNSAQAEKIAEVDPIPIKINKSKKNNKICPEGKVLNKTTNRCNNIKILKNK